MTDKTDWQKPQFIDPTTVETVAKVTPLEARDIDIKTVTSSEVTTEPTTVKNTRRSRWKRWAAVTVSGLLGAVVGSEIYRFITWGFELHSLVGIGFSALTGIAALSVIVWLAKALKGLRQLSKNEQLHQQALRLSQSQQHGNAQAFLQQLTRHYKNTPMSNDFLEAIQQVDSAYNDSEIIRFVSERALQLQDAEAKRCIKEFSTQSGLLVAVSPYATFDMLLVGWRNLKMLQKIAAIYGIAPGAATQWKLLAQVLHNIAFSGLSELVIDAGTQAVGTTLTSQISARASQGIGAGLFTLRTGSKAIELCRPLPMSDASKQSIKALNEQIIESLLKQNDQPTQL